MVGLSVVVPTFDRRASLARLLEALAAQTYDHADFEVIVVDDGSTDGTHEWLRTARTPYALKVLRQANSGPAAARNRGVAAASGEVIVFFDDDVVPEPDALAVHAAGHRGSAGRVVVGPMLPPERWRRPSWIRWEERKLTRQYRLMSQGVFGCTYRQFYTGNASLPRALVLAAGGFDPRFTRAEDVELGYRLHVRGATFAFEPAARVWHYPQRSFAAWRRAAYRYGQADVRMHRDRGAPQLDLAFTEFQSRHWPSRALVRLCTGRALALAGATFSLQVVMRAASGLGLHRPAEAALSGLFSLAYWQGASDALGGPTAIRAALAGPRPRLVDGASR